MINKLDLIKEYREMFSLDNKELASKSEYYILNDLRRRSTFDKVAEIDYSVINKFIDSEIEHFLNIDERNELLRFLEQRYFNLEETEYLKDNLTEQDFLKDYYLLSRKDITNEVKWYILMKSKELYKQIKEELEYYQNR